MVTMIIQSKKQKLKVFGKDKCNRCILAILTFFIEHATNEDDPAPTGSLSINDQLFDDYNEESDQDWAAGCSDSDSDGSIIDQGLLSHPAFHMDDDDVDVDGPEDESLYQHGKMYIHIGI